MFPIFKVYNVPGSTTDGQVDSFHYLDYVFLVFRERERERERLRDEMLDSFKSSLSRIRLIPAVLI